MQSDIELSPFVWAHVKRYVPAGENVSWRGPQAALDRPLLPFYDLGTGTVASVFVNGVLQRWGEDVQAGEHPEWGELRFTRSLNNRFTSKYAWSLLRQRLWLEACERRASFLHRILYLLCALPHLRRMVRCLPGQRDVVALCPTPY